MLDTGTVKKVYKRYSPIYNLVFNKCFQPGRELAVEIINQDLDEDAKVLEVGVGTGLSLPLYDRRLKITGIDVSKEMLKKAHKLIVKKRLAHVEDIQEMDAEHLSYNDHSFDAVVAMYVVSVVPNVDRLMNEITRVCKPGGDIIVVNHFASKNKFLNTIEKKLAKASKLIGFKADFSMEPLLRHPHLKLVRRHKTNLFGYWTVLHFKYNPPSKHRFN